MITLCYLHEGYFLKIRFCINEILTKVFLRGIDYSRSNTSEDMAEITRACKSGSKWTQNDLKAFNIRVLEKSGDEFFGFSLEEISLDGIPGGLINFEHPNDDDPESHDILGYLDSATIEFEESAVDDFAHELLKVLEFKKNWQLVRTKKDIRLFMCGKDTHAKTDVCIVDKKGIFFLLQEDKSHIKPQTKFLNPEPQIIAEAIAAFQHNNSIRMDYPKLEGLGEYTFPCITMMGTYPTFYKIKITKELDDAVRLGKYPISEALVEKFNPIVDRKTRSYGMKPLRYRKRILQSFVAFRGIYDSTLLSSRNIF
jgi:hypothetical protein